MSLLIGIAFGALAMLAVVSYWPSIATELSDWFRGKVAAIRRYFDRKAG